MLQIIYTTVDRVKRLIEEEQTTQWTKKGQTTIRVITKLPNSEQSSKGKVKTHKYTKHTHKTKDWVTRTPLKTGVSSGAPEGFAVLAPLVAPVVLI
jgi:hypothetical protein